ncbi:MAG TPA: ABC transporter permease subunit [Chloroflexi bacterium]|jgi:ABC-2 type transport system permease protein|nr:ABC transporter permease subunit [Chloroflexota bacterium]
MRNVYHVARRELGAYLASPIAYVVAAIYLAVFGGMAGFILYYSREATMRYVLVHGVILLFLVLVTQVLTMRLLADEQRQGTIELLLTSPVRDWEVVVGKYLASLVVFVLMLVLSGYFGIVLISIGDPDIPVMLSGYLGLLLLGSALLAIGVFASSVTQNQVVAAVLGMGITLLLWLSGALVDFVGGWLQDVVAYVPVFDHYFDFVRGLVDTRHIIYYISVVVLFLFLSTRVLEARRWK